MFVFYLFAVSTEKPIQAIVCQVKKADRGDTFKKKRTWHLRDIKSVDAKCYNNKVHKSVSIIIN